MTHSRTGTAFSRARGRSCKALCAVVLVMAVLALYPSESRAYYTQETRMLMRIKEVAPGFGATLERIIFQRGFARIDCSTATEKIYNWVEDNQYPHISLFLESLTEDDVATLVELFKQDNEISSTPELPIFEDLLPMHQYTVLSLPFRGEFYVLHGNDTAPDHDPAGSHRYAWDFIIMKRRNAFQDNGDANEEYFTWDAKILSPAPGIVAKVVQCNPDHAPKEPAPSDSANMIIIDHGTGEHSMVRHIKQDSAAVSNRQSLERGAVIARAGNSGDTEFPLIHFQLDKSEQGKRNPMQARFAVYFARDESDAAYRLVVSGIPSAGQYIMDVDTYIGAPMP